MDIQPDTQIIVPFLKWAGGKRWLTKYREALFDTEYERYIEPFLGSGAVFFDLCPERAILSDANGDLIETYHAIRDDWQRVYAYLQDYQQRHSKDHYYATREKTLRNPFTRAARFIYLNRTCWNGLYRVNKDGKFNVPIGTKSTVLLDSDNFSAIAEQLNKAEISTTDFEVTIEKCRQGDLLFVDPPYTVKHNHNGFIKYNETLFSWDDQVRLHHSLVEAKWTYPEKTDTLRYPCSASNWIGVR